MGQIARTIQDLDLLSKKEASEFLRCSIATINRLILRQRVDHYKIGGRVLFKKGDLLKFIEAHKVERV